MSEAFDIAIVGAGIAGASLAAEVGDAARVVLLEAEQLPGYHATGRSAAFWTESYGGPGVQPLTTASGPALHALGVLTRRGALTIARSGCEADLESFITRFAHLGVRVERLDRAALENRIPGLRAGWDAGALEPECCDIDVAALHQHYLTLARRSGVQIRCSERVVGVVREPGYWELAVSGGRTLRCAVLANAAGAWADAVAGLAGVAPLGITPLRRTMAQLRVAPAPAASLPLVLDLEERFYFKSESGRLWLSPHDETPTAPCDAAPEEIDVAIAIDRLDQVVDWRVEQVERRWAGLRSFTPDRLPVIGFAADNPAFFWFAGQGGFGIQTAPAAATMGAALILGRTGGEVDPASYSPRRFG